MLIDHRHALERSDCLRFKDVFWLTLYFNVAFRANFNGKTILRFVDLQASTGQDRVNTNQRSIRM